MVQELLFGFTFLCCSGEQCPAGFTDAMKELPVTLLYAEAARGTFEEGAISALMIVLAGTFPVILFVPAERLKSED